MTSKFFATAAILLCLAATSQTCGFRLTACASPALEPCRENRCTLLRPAMPPTQAPPALLRIENRLALTDGGFRIDKGSGALVEIGGSTTVLTASHIFREGVGEITVVSLDGRRTSATIKERNEQWDVVFLRLQSVLPPEPLNLASRSPPPGEPTLAWGFGSDGRPLAQRGAVVGYVRTKNSTSAETLKTAGRAREGDSGGPVLDSRGEIIGLLWGTDGRYTYSTCVERLKTIADSLPPEIVPPTKRSVKPKGSERKSPVTKMPHLLYALTTSTIAKAIAAAFGFGTPTLLALYLLRRLLRRKATTNENKTQATNTIALNDDYAEQLNSLYTLSGHSAAADATLGRLYDIKLRDAEESSSDEIARLAKMLRKQVADQFLRIHSTNPSPSEPTA